MDSFTQEIRSLTLAAGADLVGFAPVERFATGPEETRPDYYMPEARSVVVIAIAYPQAIGKVWGTYIEERALPGPYMWFGFAYLNYELSNVALKISKAWKATAIPACRYPRPIRLSNTVFMKNLINGVVIWVTFHTNMPRWLPV